MTALVLLARQLLKELGVQSMVYYPVPLHLQEVHASCGYTGSALSQAELAAHSCLSFPIFPELTKDQQEQVATAMRA